MTTAGWQEGYDVPPHAGSRYRGRTGGSFDIVAFINRVADQYERDNGIRVDRSARETIIRGALPHAEHVARELESAATRADRSVAVYAAWWNPATTPAGTR